MMDEGDRREYIEAVFAVLFGPQSGAPPLFVRVRLRLMLGRRG